MQDSSSRLKELYERYLSGHCSREERMELMTLIAENNTEATFHTFIDASFDDPLVMHSMPEARAEEIFQSIREKNHTKVIRMRGKQWWAAAVVLLTAMAGTWYFMQKSALPTDTAATQISDTATQYAHAGAILTLADGKKLSLDQQGKGLITTQDGSRVEMTADGLVYHENGVQAALSYNTMSTPGGRQFRLELPDGTEVMLNAASSIRYPVSFRGNERVVFLEGEAWFNVKTDKSKPFKVQMADQAAVEVLGTAFNLRCYPEDPVMKATLLSGKIRFRKNDYRKILSPGQQLQQFRDGTVKMMQADTSQVMAWKKGEFSFQQLPLEEAIAELARWYNLEPVITGKLPEFIFYGSMGRNLSPQQVVKLLNNMGLHVSLDKNRLIISP